MTDNAPQNPMGAWFPAVDGNLMLLPFAMMQAAMRAWMPMMTGGFWRDFYADVSHPDHAEFAAHAQLEVPEIIEEDNEHNMFV